MCIVGRIALAALAALVALVARVSGEAQKKKKKKKKGKKSFGLLVKPRLWWITFERWCYLDGYLRFVRSDICAVWLCCRPYSG